MFVERLCSGVIRHANSVYGNSREGNLNLATYEFEAASPYDLKDRHSPVLIELLAGDVDLGE